MLHRPLTAAALLGLLALAGGCGQTIRPFANPDGAIGRDAGPPPLDEGLASACGGELWDAEIFDAEVLVGPTGEVSGRVALFLRSCFDEALELQVISTEAEATVDGQSLGLFTEDGEGTLIQPFDAVQLGLDLWAAESLEAARRALICTAPDPRARLLVNLADGNGFREALVDGTTRIFCE